MGKPTSKITFDNTISFEVKDLITSILKADMKERFSMQ